MTQVFTAAEVLSMFKYNNDSLCVNYDFFTIKVVFYNWFLQ